MRITETPIMTTRAARGSVRARVLGLCAGFALIAALWIAPPASAAVGHRYLSQITGTSGASPFAQPVGLAVDGSNNLWVGDIGASNTLVDKFDSSGSFLTQSDGTGSWNSSPYIESLAWDTMAGQLFVADSNADDLWGLNPDASYAGNDFNSGLGYGCCYIFAAADNSSSAAAGDLYVSTGSSVVRLTSTGAPADFTSGSDAGTNTLTTAGRYGAMSAPAGLAVDASGNLYVADNGTGQIDEFAPSGAFLGAINAANVPGGSFGSLVGVAVDSATGNVYALDAGQNAVYELSSDGALVGEITGAHTPAGSFSGPEGIAVDGNGNVYVADTGNAVVDEFGPDAPLPAITLQPVSGITGTSATLNAHLDTVGQGQISSCQIEYGTSTSYGNTLPCSPAAPYSTATDVSQALTGLVPGTAYYYRLVADNANGEATATGNFITPAPTAPSPGTARPFLTISSTAVPTRFSAADNNHCLNNPDTTFPAPCDGYQVIVTNAGSAPTDGTPIAITDALPAGLTARHISMLFSNSNTSCDLSTLQCVISSPLPPDARIVVTVFATIDDPNAAGQVTNAALVGGGGSPPASTSSQNQIGGAATPFGLSGLSAYISGVDGSPDTQAGAHPYELSTEMDLNTILRDSPDTPGVVQPNAVEDPKDVVVDLPLGLLGSAIATPTCPLATLQEGDNVTYDCPPDTIVGHLTTVPVGAFQLTGIDSPIWNITPQRGVAAEFGYIDVLSGTHVLFAHVVPGPNGYVLQVSAPDISQVRLNSILTTFFGNPAVKDQSGNTPIAMFTNPSSCDGQPLTTTAYLDSWQNPGSFNADGTPNLSDPNWKSMSTTSPPVTGCNRLQFQSSLSVQPDTTVADSPSGLHVDIKVPQSEDPSSLATPPLKDASVTLPPGFTVDPSSADGLGACSSAQIDLASAASPSCPASSKIGTVQLTTPLLPGTLTGSIYLAKEFDNPFHSLIAGYIVVDDPTTGVVIKIPGNLTPNPLNGQITGVFDNNPQFPFSDLNLTFKGGERGVLATPENCGNYTTNAMFSPWSAPDSGPASTPSDSFGITSGCVSGFHPTFTAGSQNTQAGAYSPFVLSMGRSDQDQNFQGLSVTLPPGMLANLSHVQECSASQLASISSQPGTAAQQAADPSCPAGSQVGTVETGAGVGSHPYFVGGKVYLTGPYKGAPYGLAVVVPVLAGPFDLGTVVVRQALDINTTTAQVTDVSDPFPTILDGIPLRIRRVDVILNRKGFTITPTSCNVMKVSGTITSIQGHQAHVSNRFQVGGCSSLKFTPKLHMKLEGKGTRSGEHPTLVATLTQPFSGPFHQANIRSARVSLPLSLALDPNNSQHVCGYAVAKAVHGGKVYCPKSTIVGIAAANTPLLSKPLTGPVYLVQGIRFSHGHRIRTLPTLLVPLRGQIALDLRAKTSVNTKEQLVTTFPTIPDAAVSKFVLTITGGPRGLLVITGRGLNICPKPQIAGAVFNAHSGAQEILNPTISTPACHK
jgi:hypothetical protein